VRKSRKPERKHAAAFAEAISSDELSDVRLV
jgi:hypothetical protein